MGSEEKPWTAEDQELLRQGLCKEWSIFRRYRRLNLLLPTDPRCRACLRPFGGIGGRLFRLIGFGPSRNNPSFCNSCYKNWPVGGAEAEIGILFADIRGFTATTETAQPAAAAALLNRFYAMATDVLWHHDAMIDKLIGDAVTALFLISLTGLRAQMAASAEALIRGAGYGSSEGPWLPIGIGLDFGLAFVGNVGVGEFKDFTAIGDVVNTAARLQREAKPGQIVMSERVYRDVSERFPDAASVDLTLRGKGQPVQARVVDVALVTRR